MQLLVVLPAGVEGAGDAAGAGAEWGVHDSPWRCSSVTAQQADLAQHRGATCAVHSVIECECCVDASSVLAPQQQYSMCGGSIWCAAGVHPLQKMVHDLGSAMRFNGCMPQHLTLSAVAASVDACGNLGTARVL
jgi:hypothetical protein